MHVIDAERAHALLDYPGLVEALRELFRRGVDRLTALSSINRCRKARATTG